MKRIFYCSYPDYNTITHRLTRNKLCFPRLFVDSFGKSVWGKHLWCAGLGNLQNPLLVISGIHGCDYMGVLSCFAFLEYLLDTDETYLPSKLYQRGVLVVPCLNPDGLTLWQEGVFAAPDPQKLFALCGGDLTGWQGNADGIDPILNFDGNSSPEAAALCALCGRYRPSVTVCLQRGKGSIAAPTDDTAGKSISFLTGYPLCPIGDGDFSSWFVKNFGRPAYAVGQPHNGSPLQSFTSVWQKCLQQLLALLCLPV